MLEIPTAYEHVVDSIIQNRQIIVSPRPPEEKKSRNTSKTKKIIIKFSLTSNNFLESRDCYNVSQNS